MRRPVGLPRLSSVALAIAACAAWFVVAVPHVAAAQIPTSWSDFDGDGFRDLVVGAPNATVTRSGVDHPGAGAVYVMYGTANGPSATRVQVWTQDSSDGLDFIGDNSEDNDHFGAAVAAGDFNNDGAGDLAIGVPGEDRTYTAGEPLNKHVDAGAVEIIFGKVGVGLTPKNDITSMPTRDDQNNDPSTRYDGSHWGATLATDDMFFSIGGFGTDGIADLIVGAPDYNGGRGAVEGISGKDLIPQDSTGKLEPDRAFLLQGPTGKTQLGSALTTGDFDNDGIDDVAAGAPSTDFSGISNAGSVQIIYGDAASTHTQAISEGVAGNPIAPANHDIWGSALAAGDLTGDGIDDLVIGAPGAKAGGHSFAGRVQIYRGSNSGPVFDRTIDEASTNVPSNPQTLDQFGAALAVANVGRGSRLDLIVGAPGEMIGSIHAGAIFELFGTATGLNGSNNREISQNTSGIPDTSESSDAFGGELVAGQFGHAGPADVAIGVSGEDLKVGSTTFTNTGLVHVLFGATNGLSTSNDKRFDLTVISIGGQVQAKGGEAFGKALE